MPTEENNGSKQKAGFINRREILSLAVLGSIGVFSWKVLDLSLKFSKPRVVEGEFGGLFKAGSTLELPAVNGAPINFPEGRFYLVLTEDGLLAIYKTCTHLDCLFNWDGQGKVFVCPCHGSQFELGGEYLNGPASRHLDKFVIQLRDLDGNLVAETDENTGAPLPLPEEVRVTVVEPTPDAGGGVTPSPEISTGDDDQADGSELEEDIPENQERISYQVFVDTGRKILGMPLSVGA